MKETQIDWTFEYDYEDLNDELNYPIDFKNLNDEEFSLLLNKLNIGDRFIFILKSKNSLFINHEVESKGTIMFINNGNNTNKNITISQINQIGIEFDKNISGHNGNHLFKGKQGHCWFFSNIGYALKILERI